MSSKFQDLVIVGNHEFQFRGSGNFCNRSPLMVLFSGKRGEPSHMKTSKRDENRNLVIWRRVRLPRTAACYR